MDITIPVNAAGVYDPRRLDPAAARFSRGRRTARTMHDALQFTLLPGRVGTVVLGCMALLGLALASIGLYGVLLYAFSRRFREIAVRILALSATPVDGGG